MAKKTKEITIPDSSGMIEPVATKKGREIYKDNPFLAASRGFCVHVRKDLTLVAKGMEIRDQEGEEISAGVIGKIQEVDSEQFIKLYTKNLGALFDLSSRAQKALVAVFYAVQRSKDQAHIYLPYHIAIEHYQAIGIQKIPSRTTFSMGITDLIKMSFLAAHYAGEGWYWLNPNLIFNGDRIRFVTEYRLKQKEKLK